MAGGFWVALALALIGAPAAFAAPGDVALMSRSGSTGAAGDKASVDPYVSGDGQNVAFLSRATNLTGDTVTGAFNQAFVRSLIENGNMLASRNDGVAGAPADADVTDVSVSDDGSLVAFHTRATNLPGDHTAGVDRVYVRDLENGTTTLVAVNATEPSIAPGGRYVAFMSHDNYDGATGVSAKIYVYDLQGSAGVYDLVSTDTNASPTTLVGQWPRLSADGRYVVFVGQSSFSAPYSGLQILVRDRQLNTTTLVSRADGPSGADENTAPQSAYTGFSRDGRYVTWATDSTNLSLADTNNKLDVYERDLVASTTTLVSRADGLGGAVGDNHSDTPTVSDDGRYVAFKSRSTNFAPGDNSLGDNAWVRDVVTGTLTWVHGTQTEVNGTAPQGGITGVSLTGDGKDLFYDTSAHIIADDSVSFSDVFRRDLAQATVSVADAPAVTEGGPGTTAHATFTVTLSGPVAQPVTVDWNTADGTATAASGDYAAGSGQVVLQPGETSATIGVDIAGDDAVEPDETLGVTLTSALHATVGRASATTTITNDDTAAQPQPQPEPEPQPPAPVTQHTLLGTVDYRPSFAPGASTGLPQGPGLSPFRGLTDVELVGDGVRRRVTIDRAPLGGRGPDVDPAEFRFDDLPACDPCTLRIGAPGDPGADAVDVRFDGQAGQTAATLSLGRLAAGGALEGDIQAPMGAVPTGLQVRVKDVGGHILADTTRATLQVAPRPGGSGGPGSRVTPSRTASSYRWRLTGLPTASTPVVVELLQRTRTTPVVVDSAPVTLDPSGETQAPDLTALDALPDHAKGRVVFGSIATQAPYGPGALPLDDLVPDARDHLAVDLVDGSRKVAAAKLVISTGRPGSSGGAPRPAGVMYEIDDVRACDGCALVLHVGRDTKRFPVTVPSATPTVVRRDLHYPAAGSAEFLEGDVVTQGAAAARVVVTDAATGTVLADSSKTADPRCRAGSRCPVRSAGAGQAARLPYRLGGLPADRAVIVTLWGGKAPVDSEAVTTAPAGEVTHVPDLTMPSRPGGGRLIEGQIVSGGPQAPGGAPAAVDARDLAMVELVDAEGHLVAHVRPAVAKGSRIVTYTLAGLPPCDGCALQLRDRQGVLTDRAAVTVPDRSPSAAVQDLAAGRFTGGRWVQGALTLSKAAAPHGLHVQLVGGDGKVLADSATLADKGCGAAGGSAKGAGGGCAAAASFAYRLGGVPADTDAVTVVALVGTKKVGSARVTLPAGALETASPSIRMAVPKPSSGKA